MFRWLRSLTSSASPEADSGPDERVAELEARVRALELELSEAQATLERVRTEASGAREEAVREGDERVEREVRELLATLAPAVTQLNTQGYLLEREGRPVRTQDVLQVVGRLIRALEDAGLRVHDDVGERVTFDPTHHEPLSATERLAPGDTALVRFAGIDHGGRTLRKAGVTRAQEQE